MAKECCNECKNSEFALKGKAKDFFKGICGLVCECHVKSPTDTPTSLNNWEERLIERLAAIEHERWADWQKYMHSKLQRHIEDENFMRLPLFNINHWERQIKTPYNKLTEKEKQSDRDQVYRYLHLIQEHIQAAEKRGREEAVTKARNFVEGYKEKYRGCGMADSFLALDEMLEALTPQGDNQEKHV